MCNDYIEKKFKSRASKDDASRAVFFRQIILGGM